MGQYFAAIVRNKQMGLDRTSKKELLQKRYLVNEEWKQRREELKRLQEEKEAEKAMKKYPGKEVTRWLAEGEKALNTLGRVPTFFFDEIRKGLKMILSKQNWRVYLERLKQEIMSLTEFDPSKRLEMVKQATRWVEDSRNMGVKSVTLL